MPFFFPQKAQWLMSVLVMRGKEGEWGKGNHINCRFAEVFCRQIKLNKLVRWTLHIKQNNNLSYDFKQLLFFWFLLPFFFFFLFFRFQKSNARLLAQYHSCISQTQSKHLKSFVPLVLARCWFWLEKKYKVFSKPQNEWNVTNTNHTNKWK